MVRSIPKQIRGFLFSPSKTFDASREVALVDAFKYFVGVLAIYVVLSIVIGYVAFSRGLTMGGRMVMMWYTPRPLLWLAGNVLRLFFAGIFGIFIFGFWTHIWVYFSGGREGVKQTLKAFIYGATPFCLLGWIGHALWDGMFMVAGVGMIWSFCLTIIGIRQLHELPTGKAVLAFILAIAIFLAIQFGAYILISTPHMP